MRETKQNKVMQQTEGIEMAEWVINPDYCNHAARGSLGYLEFGVIQVEFIEFSFGKYDVPNIRYRGTAVVPSNIATGFVGMMWTAMILWEESQSQEQN